MLDLPGNEVVDDGAEILESKDLKPYARFLAVLIWYALLILRSILDSFCSPARNGHRRA